MATMRALREQCKECDGTGWRRGAVGVVQCRHEALRRASAPAKPLPLFTASVDPLAAVIERTLQEYPQMVHDAPQPVVSQGIRLVKGARHGR